MQLMMFTVAVASLVLSGCGEREDKFGHVQALTLCQMTLAKVSRDPEKADIPYVQNHGTGNEFYYAWGASTKMARMRNGLGLEVAASASCVVNKTTKKITVLTLNGETLI